MPMDRAAVKQSLIAGILSFPATPFTTDGAIDRQVLAHIVERAVANKAAAVFPACGAGEFFSLTADEHEAVVRVTAEVSAGRLPVLAGVGYGTKTAIEFARRAEAAGADGVLVFPPYLVQPSQEGLLNHLDELCAATSLAVVMYNRDNGVLSPANIARLAERRANLVGFKDGWGSIEASMSIVAMLGDRLAYIGGMPTAEIFAPAYKAIGYGSYSSAIFNFIPGFASRFYRAVSEEDSAFVRRAMAEFFVPYSAIRNRQNGYAVSIIKAGLKLVGHDAGSVRAPITDLTPPEMDELRPLIEIARNLESA